MHHTLNLNDGFKMQDKPGSAAVAEPVRKEYEVINELFKRGKTYKPGEKIMLVESTANNFIASGDIRHCDDERSEAEANYVNPKN
jgi:hypothetical protein